ncbi:MAG: putative acetolactate synthase large subunit [Rhodospirillales bacterium]|nr:putative acetolactate synthase large subunit [Rhodospirillales bacterium]
MNGSESLARTLVASGTDICFANPGTSEMHFVAALDRGEELDAQFASAMKGRGPRLIEAVLAK